MYQSAVERLPDLASRIRNEICLLHEVGGVYRVPTEKGTARPKSAYSMKTVFPALPKSKMYAHQISLIRQLSLNLARTPARNMMMTRSKMSLQTLVVSDLSRQWKKKPIFASIRTTLLLMKMTTVTTILIRSLSPRLHIRVTFAHTHRGSIAIRMSQTW